MACSATTSVASVRVVWLECRFRLPPNHQDERLGKLMDRNADGLIAEIAAKQHGIFTRADARAAGLSDRQLRWRGADGVIEPLSPPAFRVAGRPPSWRPRGGGAWLAAGPRA